MTTTDFDALCGAAHPNGGQGPRAAMDALWTATFALPQWHFAVRDDAPTVPFATAIGGQLFVFAFTDSDRVIRFAKENAHVRGISSSFWLAMQTDGARAYVADRGTRDLFGIHFNYAQPGWFAPAPAVDRIFAHLRSQQR